MLRKKIIRLSKLFSGKLSRYYRINAESYEYRILSILLTEKQADVALAAGLRKERTVSVLSRKSGYTIEEVTRVANDLAELGLFSTWMDDGTRKYYMDAFFPATMINVLTNKTVVANHPELGELYDKYAAKLDDMFPDNRAVGTGMVRVLPVQDSVSIDSSAAAVRIGTQDDDDDDESDESDGSDESAEGISDDDGIVSKYEKISFYLNKANRFCLSSCACAVARRLTCEGDGFIEDDKCLHLDRMAEYYIETCRGREISRQEAFDFIRKTDAAGYLHVLVNTYGRGRALTICTSKYSTCFGLRGAISRGTYASVASNFIAGYSESDCIACKECMKKCPTNALRMSSRFSMADIQKILSPKRRRENEAEHIDYRDSFEECDKSGTSPCISFCRLQMPVQSFLELTKAGEYEKAYGLMLENNPFPSITSLLCVCKSERNCLRFRMDEPVAIKDIERFLSEKCSGTYPLPNTQKIDGGTYDDRIAIIGSGVAGMSCAYFLAKKGYRPVIFEKQRIPGGALATHVPAYRIKRDVVEQEILKLERMGVEIRCGISVGEDITIDELRNAGFRAFLVAIGMQKGEIMPAAGNDADGIYTGMDYLRKLNMNEITTHKGAVVIVGDGIVAFSIARSIIRKSGNDVFLFTSCRREEIDMELEELLNTESEGVEIVNGWAISEVLNTDGRVSAAVFKKIVRKNPYDISRGDEEDDDDDAYDDEDTRTIECATLIYAGQQKVDWCGLDKQFGVEVNPENDLPTINERTLETSAPGVFVAGEMAEGEFGAADSINEGRLAAESIHRYLRQGQNLVAGRRKGNYSPVNKDAVNYQTIDYVRVQRINADYEKKHMNRRNFSLGKKTYTEDQAKLESSRCLNCGKVAYDDGKCIGCGQCVVKCPTGAIWMEKRARRDSFSSGYDANVSAMVLSRVASSKGKRK